MRSVNDRKTANVCGYFSQQSVSLILLDVPVFSSEISASSLQSWTTSPSTSPTCTELTDQGRAAYQTFQQAVVLDQVMRQAGQDPQQVNLLLRLRDAKSTHSDWNNLMTRTPTRVQDVSPFASALHLIPTVEVVVEYNVSRPVANPFPLSTLSQMQLRPQLMMQEVAVNCLA